MKKMMFAALVLMLVCVVCCAAQEDEESGGVPVKTKSTPPQPLVFRVTGVAESMPDVAVLHFNIVGDGDTMSKADTELKKTEEAVLRSLAKENVKKDQIETAKFNVTPLQPGGGSSGSSAGIQPLGYRVQRDYKVSIPITAQSLESLLKIGDAALSAGARLPVQQSGYDDSYSGRTKLALLDFNVLDTDKLMKRATDDGVARARKLAEAVAAQMGRASASLKLNYVQVFDTSLNGDRGYDGGSRSQPISTTGWQQIRVSATMEVGFGF